MIVYVHTSACVVVDIEGESVYDVVEPLGQVCVRHTLLQRDVEHLHSIVQAIGKLCIPKPNSLPRMGGFS